MVNGLEAHAALRTDTLFVVDELRLVKPRDLSQAHSEERFSDIQFKVEPGDRPPLPVHNRAGYWRENGIGKRIYMFYPAALKEATRGFPMVLVTEALVKAGALEVGSDGRRSIPTWSAEGTKPHLYHIDSAKLILPEDEEEEEIEAEQKTGT